MDAAGFERFATSLWRDPSSIEIDCRISFDDKSPQQWRDEVARNAETAFRMTHALLPLLRRKEDRRWRADIEKQVGEWWRDVEKRSKLSADPVNPELLFWELSSRLPDNAIISADSGTSANWFARALKLRRGMKASLDYFTTQFGPYPESPLRIVEAVVRANDGRKRAQVV